VATTTPTLNTQQLNPVQQEIYAYSKDYGNISAEGLVFKVQIAAYKYPKNYTYDHLKGLGKVETVQLEDGLTRFTIGGDFKTLDEAFQHNLKVIKAGQKDAFVLAIYKGKRVCLSDLVKMGVYIKKNEQLAQEIKKEHTENTSPVSTKQTHLKSLKPPTTIIAPQNSPLDISGLSLNPFQQKIFTYSEKYGSLSKDNLKYAVQVGITKNPNNIGFTKLKKYGKLETFRLETGMYIIYIGHFKTLNEALMLNKKIIQSGVKDAFTIAFYNNKRYYIDQLIQNKILD